MLLSMCVTLPTQLPRQADLPPPKRRETLLSMNRPALGESPWGVTASEHFKLRLTVRKICPFSEARPDHGFFMGKQASATDGLIMKVLGLLLKQTELFVYFIIYIDIIKHEKSMAPLIGPAQVKGRIQRSAVTLTALCYSHIFKTIVWLMLMWDPANRSVRYRVLALADCIFAIEATVEAMSVQETRTIFKNAMFKGIPSS